LLGRADGHEELPDGHRLRFASARDTLEYVVHGSQRLRLGSNSASIG
jgi:hypothetical protein